MFIFVSLSCGTIDWDSVLFLAKLVFSAICELTVLVLAGTSFVNVLILVKGRHCSQDCGFLDQSTTMYFL